MNSLHTKLNTKWKGREHVYELNHIPPKDSYKETPYENIKPSQMPVIAMEYDHHRAYISTGSSHEAKAYQETLRQYLAKGDMEGALRLDLGNMLKAGPPGTYTKSVAKYIDFLAITPMKNDGAEGRYTYFLNKEQATRLKKDLLSRKT